MDDEELSDIELVGVLDSVRLFQASYGGAVFFSDAVERFAFFDDVSCFACRKVFCRGNGECLSDGKAVGVGNAVEAHELAVGDAVASRDGEKRFSFFNAMGCRRLGCLGLGLRLGCDGGSRCGLGCRVATDDIGISWNDSADGGNVDISRYLVSFDAFVGGDGTEADFASLLATDQENCQKDSCQGNRCQRESGEERRGGWSATHAPYSSGAEGCKQEARTGDFATPSCLPYSATTPAAVSPSRPFVVRFPTAPPSSCRPPSPTRSRREETLSLSLLCAESAC